MEAPTLAQVIWEIIHEERRAKQPATERELEKLEKRFSHPDRTLRQVKVIRRRKTEED